MLQAHRWTCGCGRQSTTAFHQFWTLEVQRFGQQFSDRSGLRNECVDLSDFLGGELAPPLGRRAAVDPRNSTLISAMLKPTCLANRTIASRSSTRSS